MRENLGKIFKRGLFALAPLAISLAVIFWLLGALERVFRPVLSWILGKYYFPGFGVLVAFIFILFVGGIINNYLIQKFTSWMNKVLIRIPFFKTFYGSVGDLMKYFKPREKGEQGRMVVVEINELRFLGLVTREHYEDLPEGLGSNDRVTVFVPLSYQIGGFCVTIPRSKIKPIDMSVDQGMRFVVTAGVGGKPEDK